LELSIVDELTAIDNLDVLKKNGFVVQVDKHAPEGERPKLRLAAQPMSKNTMFDMKGECSATAMHLFSNAYN
jgi:DNA mismatch repair protein PMS2